LPFPAGKRPPPLNPASGAVEDLGKRCKLSLRDRAEPGRETLFYIFESELASGCNNLPRVVIILTSIQSVSILSKLMTTVVFTGMKLPYAGEGIHPFIPCLDPPLNVRT